LADRVSEEVASEARGRLCRERGYDFHSAVAARRGLTIGAQRSLIGGRSSLRIGDDEVCADLRQE